MATTPATSSENYSVQGKIFDVATKNGISDLHVTIYDVNRTATSDAAATLPSLLKIATRLGSVLSDASGQFTFSYGRDDVLSLASGEKKRPDLFIVVAAPDDESAASSNKVIYFSNPPRTNAGRVETYNIGIAPETQKKFGLGKAASAKEAVGAYGQLRNDEAELNKGVTEFHRAAIEKDIEDKAIIRKDLLNVLATKTEAIALTGLIVRDDESIIDKSNSLATKGLVRANTEIDNSQGVRVNLYLTPTDRKRLRKRFDSAVDGFATIPEHELQDLLFRTNSSENPGTLLVHQNPIAKFCAEQTFDEKCAKLHIGLEDAHGDDQPATPGVEPGIDALTNADIFKQLAKLLGDTPSPDSVLTPEFNNQRADRKAIEDSVDAFSLRKGPAEVPAFYDFQSLQIAFEHVWKILFDEEIVSTAHALNKKYQSITGKNIADNVMVAWNVPTGITAVYSSCPQEVPAGVAEQFDITREEWTDLSAAHQQRLLAIAKDINTTVRDHRTGGAGLLSEAVYEKMRQEAREKGERIIEAVRHDDYYTMHKTLRDLHDRINSNYEFTVFAANRNEHSVNFGLLNTYRQQWTPLNYQAGKLIKTIPLSPKEERKYSMKVNLSLKQSRKEAQKNNSSLKSEQSSISRVEAEIMAKAQNKTNFSLNTEGTYNIGISKGKSTTSFGIDAMQESSESRKDFHEAVLKASQEYNEERSVQIDTEEMTTSEYTESGTIVNPNDELAVTYLFYELQRRYRISEQLYRTTPVVLVAQEVPAPNQITESWVIANDWIINRCLLDDSFRPALQYLANKSVGDDFALRELRRNLRQQHNLVETMRIELSIASNAAANRYRTLESAISERIDEESEERTDGAIADFLDFFGGGGQDPEAAKARELAAKDAHQFAVEKAEKAAVALRQEVNNLHTFTREYNTTLRNHLDNELRVKRLLVHIRNNIFYYMQAIWSMEPPDQRFLRLHKVKVPQLDLEQIADPDNPGAKIPNRHYRVEVSASDDIFQDFREPGTTKHKAFISGELKPITEFKSLVEVADLDNLLGYKGNYMIFPMRQHNALTEFMAAPYVDSSFGAMDPDELSNVNLNDYGKYVCCLHDKLSPEKFEEIKPQLKKWLELLLADPLRNGDEIVVPTNSLFIEVLPGTHPLLENFKLRHRELDVYKVQAEVRKVELENLRLAARLLNDEREDPDIEKKVVIEGSAPIVVDPNE